MKAQDFVSWLMDEAKSRQGLRSDRALAQHLRFPRSSMTHWRMGYGFPNDQSALRLCKAASFPQDAGLVILHMLRSSGDEAAIYARIMRRAGYTLPDLKSCRNAA